MRKRVYKFEKVKKDVDGNPLNLAPAIDLLGSEVINEVTGEVLLSRDNAFYAVDRIGSGGSGYEEPGEPLIVNFTKARDLKNRMLAMVGASHPSELISGSQGDAPEDDEDDDIDKLDDETSDAVSDFNKAMSASPYAINPATRRANYEDEIVRENEDIQDFRDFLALKDRIGDIPGLKRFTDMSPAELEQFLLRASEELFKDSKPGSTDAQVEKP